MQIMLRHVLLLLATFCIALCHALFFRLIARLGGQKASTVMSAIPVFATLWGALFLSEALTPSMGLGGAIVLLGTALTLGVSRATFRLQTPLKPPAQTH
jgi:drug/metabolite transporter (DMT)-like permease